MASLRLLLVEDDDDLRSSLRRGLAEHGFAVIEAEDGATAIARGTDAVAPDLVVLDIALPDADGRDVCRALRGRGVTAPVLFLTARDGLSDRLSGFDVGGDDYLVKPFHFDELVVRLHALARRRGGPEPSTGVHVSPSSRVARCGDHRVDLTPTELRLLSALLDARGQTLERRALVAAGWSPGAIVHDNTLEQYVGRLRRKLQSIAASVTIVTVRGLGYRLE
ncbi:MAG: response regulator transcription factor [Patulibacter sp.]|nr:response regulator transcription factor [Patulibacter sp.]